MFLVFAFILDLFLHIFRQWIFLCVVKLDNIVNFTRESKRADRMDGRCCQ